MTAFHQLNAPRGEATKSTCSTIFLSLLELVKEDHPFDDDQEEMAENLLSVLSPSSRFFSTDDLLYDLVPNHEDPNLGLVESIQTLLSARSRRIVEATLSFLLATIDNSGSGQKLRLISHNIVTRLFAALQPRLEALPKDLKLEDRIIAVLSSLLPFSYYMKMNFPHDTNSGRAAFETWLTLGVAPCSDYLVYMSKNRVWPFALNTGTFTALLGSFLFTIPFYSSPLAMDSYVSFSMCYFNSFTLPEATDNNGDIFKSIQTTLSDYKTIGGQVAANGREALRIWQNEGLDDTVDKHLTKPSRNQLWSAVSYAELFGRLVGMNFFIGF
ncbi:hypothetical protein BLNAU_21205 [Blattamonas nauphoetae]|uniref:Uncharacterized protein n=1 Tax=Blattamonas nauphoetae TaxID=2049346 RepID=A0ABQ9WX14_9EUKA|nr:hypothetical protein BLNAU_21205 [Blattamonas nauphoetae]